MKINTKKRYMLVICDCEDETYIYNSIEELLKDWNCKAIEELLNEALWRDCYIYEINKEWSLQ